MYLLVALIEVPDVFFPNEYCTFSAVVICSLRSCIKVTVLTIWPSSNAFTLAMLELAPVAPHHCPVPTQTGLL